VLCVATIWLIIIVVSLENLRIWRFANAKDNICIIDAFLLTFGFSLCELFRYWMMRLLWLRFQHLAPSVVRPWQTFFEESFLRRLMLRVIVAIWIGYEASTLLMYCVGVVSIWGQLDSRTPVWGFKSHGWPIIFESLFCVGLACAFGKPIYKYRRSLLKEADQVKGAARTRARWAAWILYIELVRGYTLLFIMSITGLMWRIARAFKVNRFGIAYFVMVHVESRVHFAICSVGLMDFAGIFRWSHSTVERPQIQPRGNVSQPTSCSSDMTLWDEKVLELADRGFRLGVLLDFVALLLEGQVMPSFQPEQSTTNDVVRLAIIPLSRGTDGAGIGQALASVWNQGQPVRATRMVTHDWGNKFMHLVSAIVADAFGESEYEDIFALVSSPEGLSMVRKRAQAEGVLDISYWVCAFSVNQHQSICNSLGPAPPVETPEYYEWSSKSHDSVTKDAFHTCDCGAPKFLNDLPDLCELNKFDDMMSVLARTESGFSHVIAVDKDFNVFMRAWCVAEIVEGSVLQLSQHMVLHSQESFDDKYHRLKSLDVRACRASRIEDKTQILAKIKDIDAFNEYLQWRIFGTDNLFDQFWDWEERLVLACRIATRTSSDGQRTEGLDV
jgi:hypothetical protein